MKPGRSLFALAAGAALIPVVASLAAPAASAAGKGQCRRPAALPILPPEAAPGQGRPHGAVYAARGRVETVDVKAAPGAVPPPPAMAPPPPAMAEDSAAGAADGAAAPASPARPVPLPTAMPEPGEPGRIARPQAWPQPGVLTAGDHDDLLNPELYARYQRQANLGQDMPDLPVLDTARVLTVEARDAAGAAVARTPVEVLCADGGMLRLPTLSDGTVALFPALDRLGTTVRIRALGQPWRTVTLAPGAGGQRITFTAAGAVPAAAPRLDLMLAIDTTGSMGDEIAYLQAELGAILARLRQRHPGLDLRVGFVFYRDLGDDYVTRTVPLSRDLAAGRAELAQSSADGGGDYPEAMEQALIRAAAQPWRADATKTLLLVADAPPHDERFALAWQAAEVLRQQRVQIVPVAASGVADKAEYAMRAMAALTQSRYTFLTDDSGVGNPHAPPAIDCYLVTRLNSLLERVIDSQIAGRRIEPDRQDVIRTVGQYANGRCILPPGGLPQA